MVPQATLGIEKKTMSSQLFCQLSYKKGSKSFYFTYLLNSKWKNNIYFAVKDMTSR